MIRLAWPVPGRVAAITLDRPERRNALDLQACLDLADAAAEVVSGGARALVVQGAGGHLCSGADLATVEDPRFTPALQRALRAVAGVPGVVIAAMEGATMGGGVQLSLAADLRVAAPSARIAVPAAKLGLAVDGWTLARASAALPSGEAAALLLAAAEVTGERAHAIGFAQRLGTADDAVAWATAIADLAPLTIRAHKAGIAAGAAAEGDPGFEAARAAAWASADLQEGKAAFAARRPPSFEGR